MKYIIILFCFLLNTSVSAKQNEYILKVYLSTQTIEVFRSGKLVKKMPCSTGIKPGSTAVGKFKTHSRNEVSSWVEDNGERVSYYYTTKFNGHTGFHSMIEGKHPLVLEGRRLFNDRKPSGMGCVRLKKEGAKWIYDLPLGILVEVME